MFPRASRRRSGLFRAPAFSLTGRVPGYPLSAALEGVEGAVLPLADREEPMNKMNWQDVLLANSTFLGGRPILAVNSSRTRSMSHDAGRYRCPARGNHVVAY